MFEFNKESFGSFVAEQRKAEGYTQRELAERLFVSDKAVSKWERGLSMPDISLLIPLAEILEVSVTELLEGRRMVTMEELKQGEVERLVKKALLFSEETPEKRRERRKKHAMLLAGCCLVAILEVLVFYLLGQFGIGGQGEDFAYRGTFLWGTSFFVFELLSLIFGIYAWLFMKERLPGYYDENKISAYSEGIFRMNVPGVSFNNSNWPHIVKTLRLWSAVTIVLMPLLCFVFSILFMELWMLLVVQNILLISYLLGLFVPLYVVGKKYGMSEEKSARNSNSESEKGVNWKRGLLLFGILLVLLTAVFYGVRNMTESSSGIRIGFVSNGGRQEWGARYSLLDGQLFKNIYPSATDGQEVPYVIEIETKQGTISIELTDKNGTTVFSADEMEAGKYSVLLKGMVKVRITAEKHEGSFAIRAEE